MTDFVSSIQGVKFAPATAGGSSLAEFPAPINQQAVAVDHDADVELRFITTTKADDAAINAEIRSWLQVSDLSTAGYQLVTMHGVQIHWRLPRIVIVTTADRFPVLQQAVLDVAFCEHELRQIETKLAEIWPHVEADAPMAFEFRDRELSQRATLAKRFQTVLMLRSRLAKITPRLLIPQVYPPTLASQVQERIRERLGVSYRLESLEVQLEMFERIYDGCSQRASEYVLAKKGYTLEWIIIILLLMQVMVVLVELFSQVKST